MSKEYPDPKAVHPLSNFDRACFIKTTVKNPMKPKAVGLGKLKDSHRKNAISIRLLEAAVITGLSLVTVVTMSVARTAMAAKLIKERYCSAFLTDLDRRYDAEVRREARARHLHKNLFGLLNEVFSPMVEALYQLVLDQTPNQIRELSHQIESLYPLVGSIPYDVLRSPNLDRRRVTAAANFLYWSIFPDRHFVTDDPDQLIKSDPILSEAFKHYFERQRKEWASLKNRAEYSPRFLREWDERFGHAEVIQSFTRKSEFRITNEAEHQNMVALATPAALAFREEMRLVPLEKRIRLHGYLSEIQKDISIALPHRSFKLMEGRASQFLIALAPHAQRGRLHYEDDNFFLESGSLTPVGAYGLRFTEQLVRTSNVLNFLILQNLTETSRELYRRAPNLIERETGRGFCAIRANAWRERLPLAPRSTMQEGVISLTQLISLVLGEKLAPYATGEDLLEKLLGGESKTSLHGSSFVTSLTVRHPMGVIGPAALAGYFYKNALKADNDRVIPSPSLIENLCFLKEEEKEKSPHLISVSEDPEERKTNHTNGIGCPLAAQFGLQKLAVSFLHVFKALSAADGES